MKCCLAQWVPNVVIVYGLILFRTLLDLLLEDGMELVVQNPSPTPPFCIGMKYKCTIFTTYVKRLSSSTNQLRMKSLARARCFLNNHPRDVTVVTSWLVSRSNQSGSKLLTFDQKKKYLQLTLCKDFLQI